jgi:toxin ParE1/3/4
MPGTYRIILSPRAGSELQDIFEFVAEQSPQNAASIVERILSEIDSLETMPGRYKIERHDRKLGYGIHSMPVPPFVVFYRIEDDRQAVRVLCVQHGARRRPRNFE